MITTQEAREKKAQVTIPEPNPSNKQSRFERRWTQAARWGLRALIGVSVLYFLVSRGNPHSEPFALFEGISVWPSLFLKLAACVVCLYGFRSLGRVIPRMRNAASIESEPKQIMDRWLADEPLGRQENPNRGAAKKTSRQRPGDKFMNRLATVGSALERLFDAPPRHQSSHPWAGFVEQHFFANRFARVSRPFAGFLLACALLFLLDSLTVTPSRDVFLRWLDSGVYLASILLLFGLVFFVVDATFLQRRFILRHEKEFLPTEGIDVKDGEFGRRECAFVELITRMTRALDVVYIFPFWAFILLILSRNKVFDRYQWSFTAIVTLVGVMALLVFGMASLRYTAQQMKKSAKERIARCRLLEPKEAGRIDGLLAFIDEQKEGAYSSLTWSPLTRAALLPVGGMGGLALIEQLSPYF